MRLFLLIFFLSVYGFTQAQERVVYPNVDVYNKDGSLKGRGKIIAISTATYTVHYDGCPDTKDEVVDTSLTKPTDTLSKSDPSLDIIHGKWNLLLYDYPKDYKPNPATPPLQINAAGTYQWNDVYNKPGVISMWYQYPKLPGATKGADAHNCVVIMDRYQQFWRCYVDEKDNKLHIEKFCSDFSREGERIN